MKLNEIIRTRRQALGLTQEQLAGKLGVSAPAVNKWEKAASYPDITLLPPLARVLGVDLNTLLSFQEDLTDREIGEFVNLLAERGMAEGSAAAFALAEEKIREFPGNDRLVYSIAEILQGLMTLYPSGDAAEQTAWQETVDALYDRAAGSADPQVREGAVYTAATRCVAQGELDRAEELLNQLPDTHQDKQRTLAELRRKQGRTDEAWVLLERELFNQAHTIQTTLLSLLDLALAEGDRQRARVFSDTARREGEVMGLSDYAVLSAPFQLAAAEGDGPAALALLDRLLHSLTVPWDLSASPLYRHLPTKEDAGEVQATLLPFLLDQVETDPACAFLREMPEYQDLIQKYRGN